MSTVIVERHITVTTSTDPQHKEDMFDIISDILDTIDIGREVRIRLPEYVDENRVETTVV